MEEGGHDTPGQNINQSSGSFIKKRRISSFVRRRTNIFEGENPSSLSSKDCAESGKSHVRGAGLPDPTLNFGTKSPSFDVTDEGEDFSDIESVASDDSTDDVFFKPIQLDGPSEEHFHYSPAEDLEYKTTFDEQGPDILRDMKTHPVIHEEQVGPAENVNEATDQPVLTLTLENLTLEANPAQEVDNTNVFTADRTSVVEESVPVTLGEELHETYPVEANEISIAAVIPALSRTRRKSIEKELTTDPTPLIDMTHVSGSEDVTAVVDAKSEVESIRVKIKDPERETKTEEIVAGDKFSKTCDVVELFKNYSDNINPVVDAKDERPVKSNFTSAGKTLRYEVTKASPETDIPRQASLVQGDNANLNLTNATVNLIAGDYITKVVKDLPDVTKNNLDQERWRSEADRGFLAKTKTHLRNEIRVNQKLAGRPTMMIIDMDGNARGSQFNHVGSKTLFGRDLEKISLDQIHDPQNGTLTKHVTILGEAGAGKSTLSGMYSLDVADGNVKTLDHIQVTHFVSAATLQTSSLTTAFRLLFTDQMAHHPDTELSPREQEAGGEWLISNSSKILITIDGLDQCLQQFGNENYPIVTATTLATANHIIANIMSGRIWRDARVLTTSRWNTYWSFKSEQKPNKVVGLRGLDDKNMLEIARSLPDDGILMLIQLLKTSPKLLSLCRNPMFLTYMTKIFKKSHNTLPDSLTSLMSAFFREFLSPSTEKYYGHITKLGYEAMRENKFVFPYGYLSSLGIDPKLLDDFLSTGAIRDENRVAVKSTEKFSEFSHQTMQEFCCALHVPNLTREEIKEFVVGQLNDGSMDMTRQLLYGLMLDEKVTQPMSNYLSHKKTTIQECREILMEQLDSKMENGTINEMQTIKLLSECGDETIDQISRKVQRIVIAEMRYMPPNDRLLLVSMIQKLSPLEELIFHRFTVEPSLIQLVKGFLSFVVVFKVKRMIIEDTHLTHESLIGYFDIFRQCVCSRILLCKCNLTKDNLIMIAEVCRSLDIQLQELIIFDRAMPLNAYSDIASVVKSAKCSVMRFNNCLLSEEKLQRFWKSCKESQVSLQELIFFDRKMPLDAYCEVAAVVKATECSNVRFIDCRLSKEKLQCFGNSCKENQISLQKLIISDRRMPLEAYSEVAAVAKDTKCSTVRFFNCLLSKEKLECFGMSCKECQITLQELCIYDRTMPSDAYSELAAVVKATKCSTVRFVNCLLSKEKLHYFRMSCEDSQVSDTRLEVSDAKMPADAYREIACTLKSIGCKEFYFKDCELTTCKLSDFYAGCKDNDLSLDQLSIEDGMMSSDVYGEVAAIISVTSCSRVIFTNCDLTKEKMEYFGTSCMKNQASLVDLCIRDRTMPLDAYSVVTAVVKATKCIEVSFLSCDLSMDKIECLVMSCKKSQVTIPILVMDWSQTTATESEVSALRDLMIFSVDVLALMNWKIDTKGTQRLKDTLQLESSMVKVLCLPNGDTFAKGEP